MDPTTSSHIPRARSKGLLVEHLDDETLVYDLSSHEAHCLNKAAAHVWGMADGEYTVAQIAGTLPDVGLPADESIVAASCLTESQCESLNKNNCTGLPICEDPSECCVRKGKGCRARNCC